MLDAHGEIEGCIQPVSSRCCTCCSNSDCSCGVNLYCLAAVGSTFSPIYIQQLSTNCLSGICSPIASNRFLAVMQSLTCSTIALSDWRKALNLLHNFRASAPIDGMYFARSLLQISLSVCEQRTYALSWLGSVSSMMRFAIACLHSWPEAATGGCSSV